MIVLALVAGLVLGAGLAMAFTTRRDRRQREDDRRSPSKRRGAGRLNEEQETRLLRALNAVPIGIVVFEDGRSVFANRFAHQFDSGRHSDALVDQAITDLVSRASVEGPLDDQLDLYGPPPRQLSMRALPLETGDKANPQGILVIIEETSERSRVEAVRRDFVANVSHELKTPVGAMGILAETLVEERDSEVIQRLSVRLHDEAIRLGTTIDDLLTLSTIETGETFEPAAIDITHVVQSSLDRVQAAADLRGITITIESDGDLIVEGDRRQLESAISNLLDNAIKYSDSADLVEVVARRVDDYVDVAVTDSGAGIPERDLERIFERFYRVDQARSRSTGGTGLGLSIVRHVALNHGGSISVHSKEGLGTSFVLRIKVDPQHSAAIDQTPDGEELVDVG